jgi:hypothetical protein
MLTLVIFAYVLNDCQGKTQTKGNESKNTLEGSKKEKETN